MEETVKIDWQSFKETFVFQYIDLGWGTDAAVGWLNEGIGIATARLGQVTERIMRTCMNDNMFGVVYRLCFRLIVLSHLLDRAVLADGQAAPPFLTAAAVRFLEVAEGTLSSCILADEAMVPVIRWMQGEMAPYDLPVDREKEKG